MTRLRANQDQPRHTEVWQLCLGWFLGFGLELKNQKGEVAQCTGEHTHQNMHFRGECTDKLKGG